jgi:hypothetical protein
MRFNSKQNPRMNVRAMSNLYHQAAANGGVGGLTAAEKRETACTMARVNLNTHRRRITNADADYAGPPAAEQDAAEYDHFKFMGPYDDDEDDEDENTRMRGLCAHLIFRIREADTGWNADTPRRKVADFAMNRRLAPEDRFNSLNPLATQITKRRMKTLLKGIDKFFFDDTLVQQLRHIHRDINGQSGKPVEIIVIRRDFDNHDNPTDVSMVTFPLDPADHDGPGSIIAVCRDVWSWDPQVFTMTIDGLECNNKLDALIHTLIHELVHVITNIACYDANVYAGDRNVRTRDERTHNRHFQDMLSNIAGSARDNFRYEIEDVHGNHFQIPDPPAGYEPPDLPWIDGVGSRRRRRKQRRNRRTKVRRSQKQKSNKAKMPAKVPTKKNIDSAIRAYREESKRFREFKERQLEEQQRRAKSSKRRRRSTRKSTTQKRRRSSSRKSRRRTRKRQSRQSRSRRRRR